MARADKHRWDWKQQTPVADILEEIASHAETHSDGYRYLLLTDGAVAMLVYFSVCFNKL